MPRSICASDRSPLHRVVAIAIGCGLMGLVIAVAVAFVLGRWVAPDAAREAQATVDRASAYDRAAWRDSEPPAWASFPNPAIITVLELPGATYRLTSAGASDSGPFWLLWRLESGWPLPCLAAESVEQPAFNPTSPPRSFIPHERLRRPFRVLWLPFLANTVLYATACLLLVWAAGRSRWLARRLRHRCLACGASRTADAHCPRCGVPRSGPADLRALARAATMLVILPLVVSIVIGAVVTVAIAWRCAVWSAVEKETTADIMISIANGEDPYAMIDQEHWCSRFGIDPSRTNFEEIPENGFGLRRGLLSPFPKLDPDLDAEYGTITVSGIRTVVAIRTEAGWPFPALRCDEWLTMDPRWSGNLVRDGTWVGADLIKLRAMSAPRGHSGRAVLPYRPMHPGFATNVGIFAAAAWLCFIGPLGLRRLVRLHRGRCPACGYPAAAGVVCSECGRPLPALMRPRSSDVSTHTPAQCDGATQSTTLTCARGHTRNPSP